MISITLRSLRSFASLRCEFVSRKDAKDRKERKVNL